MCRSAILLCALASLATAGQVPPSLAQVKERVLQDLRRLPNCTCTETIKRSFHRRGSRAFTSLGSLQVDVGYVHGEELYSRPGGKALSESGLSRLISGTVSTGDFLIMASNLFTSPSAEFAAAGEEIRAGRAALRYDFRAPARRSYWIVSDQLPRDLDFATLDRIMQYTRVRIGASDLLLPSHVVMSAVDLTGYETKLDIEFDHCREYAVESLLHFGADTSIAAAGSAPPAPPVAALDEPPEEPILANRTDGAPPEAIRALAQAGRRAAGYIAQLPDFLCVQTTRTYIDPSGANAWKSGRTATYQLQYLGGEERYSPVEEGPRPPASSPQNALLSSTGEFAAILKTIFAPEVNPSMEWKGATVVDGEPLYAFSFHASRANALYSLVWGSYPKQVAVAGFEGVVYIGQNDSSPRRIDFRATELPAGFPMRDASLSVRFGFVSLGGRAYLLPTRAYSACAYGKRSKLRSEVEFSQYRKYTAESKIGFDPAAK